MPNPFEYGTAVTGDSFCNRRNEMRDLRSSIDSAERLFIFSERRMGKTSLILNLRESLDLAKYVVAYVDLFPTDSEETFAAALAKALATSVESRADRVLGVAKKLFSRFTPSLSVDEEGKPQLSLGLSPNMAVKESFEEVLAAPAKLAAESDRRIVIIFDEFQRIMEYDEGERVERTIRTMIQNQPGVEYIFLGSRKHLLEEMFMSRSRPLFRSAGRYPLGTIDVEHWRGFLGEKFASTHKKISAEMVDLICSYTEGHPSYTQQLCHAVWGLVDHRRAVTSLDVEKGVQLLLRRESYAYTILWESLPLNQRRLLRGLALEKSGVGAFTSGFMAKYGLASTSTLQRVLPALLSKDIIDRDVNKGKQRYYIVDRFFKVWIRKREESLALS